MRFLLREDGHQNVFQGNGQRDQVQVLEMLRKPLELYLLCSILLGQAELRKRLDIFDGFTSEELAKVVGDLLVRVLELVVDDQVVLVVVDVEDVSVVV